MAVERTDRKGNLTPQERARVRAIRDHYRFFSYGDAMFVERKEWE